MRGYHALTGANVKLGRWDEYLAMRDGLEGLNATYRDLHSNDLGAIAGLLFDIGSGRYQPPPLSDDASARATWETDLASVRATAAQERALATAREQDRTHTEIQGWLRDLGMALGYDMPDVTAGVGGEHAGRRTSASSLHGPRSAASPISVCATSHTPRSRNTGMRWLDSGRE